MRFSLRSLLLVVALVALLLGVWRLLLPERLPYHLIEIGMTAAEVELILGQQTYTSMVILPTGEYGWFDGFADGGGVCYSRSGNVYSVEPDKSLLTFLPGPTR